jgi:hypothetical protein
MREIASFLGRFRPSTTANCLPRVEGSRDKILTNCLKIKVRAAASELQIVLSPPILRQFHFTWREKDERIKSRSSKGRDLI